MRGIYKLIRECFQEILREDFKIQDNVLYFDPSHQGNINTSIGKKYFEPRITTFSGLDGAQVFSVYSKPIVTNKEEVKNILNSLKGKGPYKVDPESYQRFIKRTAIYFYSILKAENIEVAITIQSAAGISKDLKDALLEMFPYKNNILVFDEGVIKNPNFHEITIADIPNVNPKTLAVLQKKLEKVKDSGYFKIQTFPAQFRKHILNWLRMQEGIKSKIVGKNVLLIDDFITSGTTLKEAIRMMQENGAANVMSITLIK